MLEFLRNAFNSDFMAHGYCYRWRPEILWLHVLSDALITLAYYSIPVILVYFVRKRRDVPFHWVFLMFGAFILSCGTTHAMEVWTVWHGTYRIAGVIKVITATLSTGTAIALIPLMPRALALPSPARLEEINRELGLEVQTRKQAQEEINELNESLERRVHERTAQLEAANRVLQIEIHQRKQAEKRFRLAVEAAPNAMVMVNDAGDIVLVNSETERLFGYRREELLGQPIGILVPESSRVSHPAFRSAFMAEPRARRMGAGRDFHAQRKDGSEFPVEIGLNPIETEGATWVLSSIVDITERKRVEERFRWAVEAAPNAVVMVDGAGKIVLVNSETERLFGYERDELLGQPIEILVPQSSRKGHADLRDDFLRNPHARPMGVGGDLRGQRKDGSQFPVEIALNPIETVQGTWVLSSIVDITFHRQKLESVGVLASGIAHDFNNLLGSILADTELALSDLAPGAPPSQELEGIRGVAIRASEIVRELMIYAGQEEPTRELVDVSCLVQEMAELLRVSISKHAVLQVSLGGNLPPVLANPPQMRQVVMNLILNASDALGDRDGVIGISTSRVAGGRDLALSSATELAEGDYLLLEVSDTGKGMSEEQKAKIFDPFFTTKFAGRGLGLAVVQGIVRSHSGAINLRSAIGQGTTFQIFLPCTSGLTMTASAVEVQPDGELLCHMLATVLVVEDEDSLRVPVTKVLRRNGFTVIEASDGTSAIELFRVQQSNIDAALLDLTIPGTSSTKVIAELRSIRPDIQIILTSAYELAEVFPPPGGPEVAGFIRKPFHLSDLVQLLRDVLATKHKAGA